MQYNESREQSTIAGYLKKNHPDLVFHTTRLEGKREKWEQQQLKKQNSESGIPDTIIWLPGTVLMLENKKYGTRLTLKDGATLATDHLDNQYACHQRLWNLGHKVYFAVGISDAIYLIQQALKGYFPPQQLFKRRVRKEDLVADAFFSKYFG